VRTLKSTDSGTRGRLSYLGMQNDLRVANFGIPDFKSRSGSFMLTSTAKTCLNVLTGAINHQDARQPVTNIEQSIKQPAYSSSIVQASMSVFCGLPDAHRFSTTAVRDDCGALHDDENHHHPSLASNPHISSRDVTLPRKSKTLNDIHPTTRPPTGQPRLNAV
jgi:hypothetical protein